MATALALWCAGLAGAATTWTFQTVPSPPGTSASYLYAVSCTSATSCPGQSARVTFSVTPRDTWWWDQRAGGWSQTAGTYRVYVGDSSALAGLPLQGSFAMTSTPAARQAVVSAPRTVVAGQQVSVQVRLTASGNETLHGVRFSLQAPQGWLVHATGSTVFSTVAPAEAPVVTFTVQPPAGAPAADSVLYATIGLGGQAQRQAGATVRVSG